MSVPNHPALKWPRSDGHPHCWPRENEKNATGTYFTKTPITAQKYALYQKGMGAAIAEFLKLPPPYEKYAIDMPEGYALFTHHQPRDNGEERTDMYLCGSQNVTKFRSVPEMREHAIWLFDTSRPIDDHSTCNCKYSSSSGRTRGVNSPAAAGTSKRPSGSNPGPRPPKKPRAASIAESDDDSPTGIVPERLDDFIYQRRFRKGELIWFRIDTINPPPSAPIVPPGQNDTLQTLSAAPPPPTSTSSIPSITHWPGLIAGLIPRTSSSAEGVLQFWEYKIRPLGMFAPNDDITRDIKDLLPFSVGDELMGGEAGWQTLGDQGTKVILKGVEGEAMEEIKKGYEGGKLPNIDERWKSRWGARLRFSEMPKTWDAVVLRLAIALKIAFKITECWAQTDRIDVIGETNLSEEDRKDLEEQKKTLYQGLWWGGERIWLGDLVRLRLHRKTLPEDSLGRPSPEAVDRAVFYRINMISIEVAPESKPDDVNLISWRCLTHGDIFELVDTKSLSENSNPATWTLSVPIEQAKKIEPTNPGITGSSKGLDGFGMMVPLEKSYLAPPGTAYKQLNPIGHEVALDVLDIAGRVYPDLLDFGKQSWFQDPQNIDSTKGRIKPGETVTKLMGLQTGLSAMSTSENWKDDLYTIVLHGNKVIEKEMKDYYSKVLHDQLRIALPPKPRKPRESKDKSGEGGNGGVQPGSAVPNGVGSNVNGTGGSTSIAAVQHGTGNPTATVISPQSAQAAQTTGSSASAANGPGVAAQSNQPGQNTSGQPPSIGGSVSVGA